jgi:hypothetical protein
MTKLDLSAVTPKPPVNLRVELEPYPHLRDDEGCVLAADYTDEAKLAYILMAVENEVSIEPERAAEAEMS